MKQYLPNKKIVRIIGGSYNQIFQTLAYWSMVNTMILLVLGWDSKLGDALKMWFPWLNFYVFGGGLLAIFLTIMIVDLMFIFPAVVAFTNEQFAEHSSPIYTKLKEIEKLIKDRMGEDINLI